MLDVTLQTGGLSEMVTVEARTTPLQFDSQNRKTIELKDVQDMALNGRNPINLAMLKAGVRGGSFNSMNADSLTTGGFNINGSRSDENLITIDGAIATRTRSNGAIIGTVNVDTVQEIQVLTSNYLPEYGRSSGGQIRFVTKGGGHDFHGSLYEYVRNDKFDANSWSRNAANNPLLAKPAPLHYNQFGGTIGGPLTIPGKFNTTRDKLFFFWAEEGIRWRTDGTNTGTVPSDKMRNGDFSELLDPTNLWFNKVVTIKGEGRLKAKDRMQVEGESRVIAKIFRHAARVLNAPLPDVYVQPRRAGRLLLANCVEIWPRTLAEFPFGQFAEACFELF